MTASGDTIDIAASNRARTRWMALAIACLLCIVCCEVPRRWTPYKTPGKPEMLVDGKPVNLFSMAPSMRERLNEGCVSCHEGVHDPHPTIEIACVYCHGGDGTEKQKRRLPRLSRVTVLSQL